MIEVHVRPMNAAERADLELAMRPPGPRRRQPLPASEAWGPVLVAVLTLAVIALAGGNKGGLVIAGAAVVLVAGYQLVAAAVRNKRNREYVDAYIAKRHRKLARVLEDGRVTVKRVRAVAVVELQPMEDEGAGYLFALGDGRVLFLKGQDYEPTDDDDPPWPNTDFEIVRAALDDTFIGLHCHGDALPPLRLIPGDDCDPQSAWHEREELLDMTLDEAVKTVLRQA
ncbi:MAG TPA: hypothetical protein VGB92_11385 [Longimicrobium sp.]|jgi:hypothetical protein